MLCDLLTQFYTSWIKVSEYPFGAAIYNRRRREGGPVREFVHELLGLVLYLMQPMKQQLLGVVGGYLGFNCNQKWYSAFSREIYFIRSTLNVSLSNVKVHKQQRVHQ